MKLSVFAAIAILLLVSGCSFCESSTQLISINVTPRDATVVADSLSYTGAPMFVEVKRSNELMLLIYKPGYQPQTYVLGNHLSTTGILDACGSIFIFPFFGLMSNGAWELNETNLHFTLQPLPPEKQEETEVVSEEVSLPTEVVSEEVSLPTEVVSEEVSLPTEVVSEAPQPQSDATTQENPIPASESPKAE